MSEFVEIKKSEDNSIAVCTLNSEYYFDKNITAPYYIDNVVKDINKEQIKDYGLGLKPFKQNPIFVKELDEGMKIVNQYYKKELDLSSTKVNKYNFFMHPKTGWAFAGGLGAALGFLSGYQLWVEHSQSIMDFTTMLTNGAIYGFLFGSAIEPSKFDKDFVKRNKPDEEKAEKEYSLYSKFSNKLDSLVENYS